MKNLLPIDFIRNTFYMLLTSLCKHYKIICICAHIAGVLNLIIDRIFPELEIRYECYDTFLKRCSI